MVMRISERRTTHQLLYIIVQQIEELKRLTNNTTFTPAVILQRKKYSELISCFAINVLVVLYMGVITAVTYD